MLWRSSKTVCISYLRTWLSAGPQPRPCAPCLDQRRKSPRRSRRAPAAPPPPPAEWKIGVGQKQNEALEPVSLPPGLHCCPHSWVGRDNAASRKTRDDDHERRGAACG